MATAMIEEFMKVLGPVLASPGRSLWSTYDADTDTLYINFKKPSLATDSELTDDDVILRYESGELIGLTILNAGARGLRAA